MYKATLHRLAILAIFLLALAAPRVTNAQAFPPAWTSSATYAAGDIVQYGGNWYRAMKALSAAGPYPANAYGDWELNFVRSNTTLTVGDKQGFANLVYVWQFARNARIADAAYLHISIVTTYGDFSESFTAPFSLDHGSGALISIIGDTAANISLSFPDGNAFQLDNGHSFGTISNLSITGPGPEASNGQGFTLLNSAALYELTGTTIKNFSTGVYAYEGASVYMDSDPIVACTTAISSDQAASVSVGGLNLTVPTANSIGLYADHNGIIIAGDSNITSPNQNGTGAEAENGGVIDVSHSTFGTAVNETVGIGCKAEYGGRIVVTDTLFWMGSTYDIVVDHGGTVNAAGVAASDPWSTGMSDGSYILS
jgi:hypothetical protein